MTRDEFKKKHSLNDEDMANLDRFEKKRNLGEFNMFEYLTLMTTMENGGGKKLADWIQTNGNYEEFQGLEK